MKINVRQIGEAGYEIRETFPAQATDLSQKDTICFVDPVKVRACFTRVDDEVFAAIAAASRFESFCYRCLEVIRQDWNTAFTLTFHVEKQTEFIEIDEDIRQELILNLPQRLLCRDDCKGLCVECGANLNHHSCKHKHEVTSKK